MSFTITHCNSKIKLLHECISPNDVTSAQQPQGTFYCFLCSWADDGRGCGACEHFGQLESGGQNYPLHQDTREEEDIWQRQLPVSNRYYSVCVCLWIWALCKWACLDITHHLLLEKIKQTAGITAVFVNVERLSPLSEVSLSSFCFCSRAAYRKVLSTNSHFSSYRGSWRRPGGSKFLTDTQWSYTFFVAMPGLRRPSYRFLWQRSPC